MNVRVLRRSLLPYCFLLTCLGLAACGDLPEPFLGNPGATARRLAQPPAPLLAIAPGSDTLLPDKANQDLADQLAKALQATEVPAMVRTPQKTDWQLVTRATQTNNMVRPEFSVVGPDGKEQGKAVGEPVPIADWAMASPELIKRIAAEAAPRVGAVLTGIRIAQEKADPNSLYNRAAKVMVANVTGAPGDGNDALTRQMRARLAVLGPVVLTTPTDADFIVQGKVAITPLPQHKERVEVQWSVRNAKGDERGKVVQLNEIPAGTLDHYWGDVAVVVAAQASGGVNDVIQRQSDREPTPTAADPSKPAQADQPQPAAPVTAGPQSAVPVHPASAKMVVAPAASVHSEHGHVARSAVTHASTAKSAKQTATAKTASKHHQKKQAAVQ